jgi:patatin-like phospholipase/acyl hydrolase
MSRLIKILSIDGGGIRGIIPAKILSYLEEKTDQRICRMFDLICGTSTGGILALGLTKPGPDDPNQPQYRAADLIKIYEEKGQTIFSRNIWQKIHSAWNLTDEKYDSLGIESVLWDYFQDVFLSQALTELVIPSYEIENRDCFFFKTRKAKEKPQINDFLMRQVARSTFAAPTYFEPCRMAAEHDPDDPSDPNKTKPYWALIDGGCLPTIPPCAAMPRLYPYGRARITWWSPWARVSSPGLFLTIQPGIGVWRAGPRTS